MKVRSYQQCTRCVMNTTDVEIVFDENGYCNHCTEFLSTRSRYMYRGKESDERLDGIIEGIRRAGKGNEYDCIIGLSGGVDSSYLAYIAKEKGLRSLAVHMDNGWSSKEAVMNIKNITGKLGIDYESYVLDWEQFKDLQLAFLKASVPEAETPTDIAILAALHHFAAKHNVKYILSGGNLATEGILPKSWHYNAKDLKYFDYIRETFGVNKVKDFPTFGYKRELYFKLIRGIRMIYPLNYMPFAKTDAVAILSQKFDWKSYGGKHHESRYTKFIHSYYLYEKFGIDYRRATLSTQICCGEIQYDDATSQLQSKPFEASQIEEEKQYISKKLDLPRDEFEKLLQLPPKWYWDYPNDGKRLGVIYNTYRKLFGKEQLATS